MPDYKPFTGKGFGGLCRVGVYENEHHVYGTEGRIAKYEGRTAKGEVSEKLQGGKKLVSGGYGYYVKYGN